MIYGIIGGAVASYIPYIAVTLQLSPTMLSVGFFSMMLGSIIGSTIVARLRVTPQSGIYLLAVPSVLVILPIACTTGFFLMIAAFIYGATRTAFDVLLNTLSVTVQDNMRHAFLARLHGCYSVGVFLGAVFGTEFMRLGYSVMTAFSIIALLGVFMNGIAVMRTSLLSQVLIKRGNTFLEQSSFPLWKISIGTLCMLAFSAAMTEGGIDDWSGMYLVSVVHTQISASSYGLIGFNIATATMRFLGDHFITHFGQRNVLITSGSTALASIVIILLFPYPVSVVIGFIGVGLGVANMFPVINALAGTLSASRGGNGVAHAAAAGGIGCLFGPPIIGAVAVHAGLHIGFAVIACACAMLLIVTLTAVRTRHDACLIVNPAADSVGVPITL